MRRRDGDTPSAGPGSDGPQKRHGAFQVRSSVASARLSIELVPETCWVSEIREIIPPLAWERLRHRVAADAKHRCEVCGQRAQDATECQELWEYDEADHTQRLKRMIAVCRRCHEVMHIDRAGEPGRAHAALEHLAVVNRFGVDEAQRHRATAFRRWRERSRHCWFLDLQALRAYGLDPDGLMRSR